MIGDVGKGGAHVHAPMGCGCTGVDVPPYGGWCGAVSSVLLTLTHAPPLPCAPPAEHLQAELGEQCASVLVTFDPNDQGGHVHFEVRDGPGAVLGLCGGGGGAGAVFGKGRQRSGFVAPLWCGHPCGRRFNTGAATATRVRLVSGDVCNTISSPHNPAALTAMLTRQASPIDQLLGVPQPPSCMAALCGM